MTRPLWETEGDGPNVFHRHGYQCLTIRSATSGGWCGYVRLPRGHLWFGKNDDTIDAQVHGGVTWCREYAGGLPPDPDSWWIGFDTAHYGDHAPAIAKLTGRAQRPEDTYRDLVYVTAECDKLAAQVAAADPRAVARRLAEMINQL